MFRSSMKDRAAARSEPAPRPAGRITASAADGAVGSVSERSDLPVYRAGLDRGPWLSLLSNRETRRSFQLNN